MGGKARKEGGREGKKEKKSPIQLVHTTLPNNLFSKSSFLPAIADVFRLMLCFNASAFRSPSGKVR